MNMEHENEALWRLLFQDGHPKLERFKRFHRLLPASPRCVMCAAPFRGFGGVAMRILDKGRSWRNNRFCNACDKFINTYPGGADVDMTLLFADVRDSVTLGQNFSGADVAHITIDYYDVVKQQIAAMDGFVIEYIGDAVASVFPRGFSGKDHARKAIYAAERIIRSKMPVTPNGEEIRVGVGVYTAKTFIGTMDKVEKINGRSVVDINVNINVQAVGDPPNITSRLSTNAAGREALISEATLDAAGVQKNGLELREIPIRGRSAPVAATARHSDQELLSTKIRRHDAIN
jgi:adenylate cyclase